MAQSFTEAAVLLFANRANQDAAGPMEAYMKNQFPFLGVKTPLRRELSKRLYREQGIPENWETVVRELWALPEREYQYVALDLLEKVKKRFAAEHVGLAEELITGKSWWDTVDYLASHMVGTLFRLNPALIGDNNERWLEGASLWLQRTTLLFQLSYKEKTDEELLFKKHSFLRSLQGIFHSKSNRLVIKGVCQDQSRSGASFRRDDPARRSQPQGSAQAFLAGIFLSLDKKKASIAK